MGVTAFNLFHEAVIYSVAARYLLKTRRKQGVRYDSHQRIQTTRSHLLQVRYDQWKSSIHVLRMYQDPLFIAPKI